jgi:TatD DNase family protein
VGIHPCNSSPFSDSSSSSSDTATILSALQDLATNSASEVVAYGELGLDYDRLSHCSKEVQIASFNAQLDLFAALPPTLQKPLFLHSRAAHADFAAILRERIEKGELGRRGVVHSFTGTEEEMLELVTMGFDIGVNGCSLKTEENCAVVRGIPLSRLQLETDGPWCEMRPTHAGTKYAEGAGYVETVGAGMEASKADKGGWKSVKKEKWVHGALIKGRNESCLIPRVGWAVAGVKGVGVREVCEAAWENSSRMFGIGDEVNGAAVASGKGADNTP